MGKSLTEVAKAVLMNESNDSAPDAGAKSMNPNMATLRPGSKYAEGRFATPPVPDVSVPARWNPPDGQKSHIEIDAVTDAQDPRNLGALSAKDVGKDKSKSGKSSVPAQAPEKMMAEDEEIEEGLAMVDKDTGATVGGTTGVKPKPGPGGNAPGSAGRMSGMTMKEEDLEEDIEISEELEAFIDQCLEEGMSEEEIAEAIDENFEILEEDYDDLEEDVDYEYTVDMSEHVAALFEGEDLSEEFQAKAIAIFEAAVTSTVKSELGAIEEAYAATLEEEVNELKEELSSNVDDYLNYVVENWVSENEVAIEAGLRTELTEEFISGLRNLFAENYIDIPEDKISVVEELGNKVAELENKLNEEIERNVELSAILSESKKTEVMYAMTEGLTATQAEKLKSLAENVEFTSEEEYAHKVATLRESYFPSSITSQNALDYIDASNEGKTMISEGLEGPMAKYVEVLGKKLPN
jgi:hypothetical protein